MSRSPDAPDTPRADDTGSRAFAIRTATPADIDAMMALMERAIRELQAPFLSPAEVQGSFEIMGIDTQLIDDGTYFVVQEPGAPGVGSQFLGCGGWSRRATLFGGDHSAGRDARTLDPASEPARVRAMYTHPDHVRRGVGRAILAACEQAARSEGFVRVELAATLAGEPLYRACGYAVIEPFTSSVSSGLEIPLLRMGKAL